MSLERLERFLKLSKAVWGLQKCSLSHTKVKILRVISVKLSSLVDEIFPPSFHKPPQFSVYNLFEIFTCKMSVFPVDEVHYTSRMFVRYYAQNSCFCVGANVINLVP